MDLREVLADAEHSRWSRWQSHLHSKCVRNPDGSLTIPAGYVSALERLIAAPYADLSETQKDSDRREADNTLAVVQPEIERLTIAKDGAYAERNKLVALVAALFPSSLERHDGADWEDDWRWIVFIDLPAGQASWHLHDSELPLFAHVPRLQGRRWDGHLADQKYERVAQTARQHVMAI